MNCTRRSFLKGSLATIFFSNFNVPLYGSIQSPKKNIVIISLRGGMDGLAAVPVSDPLINRYRSELILNKKLRIDSDFSLHPKLKTLHTLWSKNLAAVIHATNIPYTKRSHFDGQNIMETGALKAYVQKTGWLGRGMKSAGLYESGLALSLPMPLLLRGVEKNNNYYPTWMSLPKREIIEKITQAYEGIEKDKLQDIYNVILNRPLTMQGGDESLETLSKRTAKILKDPLGPKVAVFDLEGFDTHTAQGNDNGEHAENLQDVDLIIRNLYEGMGSEFDNTLIMTLTEFGRTVEQNGGNGTEHGYGSAILMAGGILKKSQVYTDWPGLKKSNLFEDRDLLSTIDARSIYASAMSSVFSTDFEKIKKDVFWNEDIKDLSSQLFRS
tara:strand:+ start:1043 stop:2191 length:1149 start_codon:yes stop_codon:yes gene_type:complete